MKGGWFIGDFDPACLKTGVVEVAYKTYKAGQVEARHLHRIATEITLIASGRVRMSAREYIAGDIILLDPGDSTDFAAIEDAATVVVKMPSSRGDKYLV
jgi:quercetin dioxygenase-like cupin family protein